MVPFPRPDDIGLAASLCASFVIDNGAYTIWKRGGAVDCPAYVEFVEAWCRHPAFDWALIPDVIEGDEAENDALLAGWPQDIRGVPVWHFHESIERLVELADHWDTVALGSSGDWPTPGTSGWWSRVGEAMGAICSDDGKPACRLHGLRMMSADIFTRLPLSSADSTNVVRNCCSDRFGTYTPPTRSARAAVIADRIEYQQSAPLWNPAWAKGDQLELW